MTQPTNPTNATDAVAKSYQNDIKSAATDAVDIEAVKARVRRVLEPALPETESWDVKNVTRADLRALLARLADVEAENARLNVQDRLRAEDLEAITLKCADEMGQKLALLDEVTQLREDKARLDWLAERSADYDRWVNVFYGAMRFPDIRKMVDARRTTEGTR